MTRKILLSLAATAIAVPAMAQFDGPAPLSWRFQASMGTATGSPLVDGDVVFYPNGGRIVSIDRETGNKRWQYPQVERIPGVFKGSPIMAGGNVVAAADNKFIYAIDAKGATKWSYAATDPIVGQIIQVGRYIVFQQSGNKLMAIDSANGSAAWDTPYVNSFGLTGGIASTGTDILFFNSRNDLVSLNPESRKVNWSVPLVSTTAGSSPVVSNGTIYVNCSNALVALSADTHRLRWQKILSERLALSPAVSESAVFSVSLEGNVYGWDLEGNSLNTKAKFVSLNGSLATVKPLAIGKKVIVPTTNGAVNLIDPTADAGKQILWSYLMRPSAEYAAASGDGNQSGNAGGFGGGAPGFGGGGQGSGGPIKTSAVESAVTISASATPALAGSTLLVPARDGTLLAFDKNTGVDLTAPKVQMVFPNPGDQVSPDSPLQLWFKIEDDASGINASTLAIEIDGAPMETKLEKDGSAVVRFSSTGKNRRLSEGRKTIIVRVSDYMGNLREQKFALTIDSTLRPVKLPGTTDPNSGFNGGAGGGKGGGSGLGGGG